MVTWDQVLKVGSRPKSVKHSLLSQQNARAQENSRGCDVGEPTIMPYAAPDTNLLAIFRHGHILRFAQLRGNCIFGRGRACLVDCFRSAEDGVGLSRFLREDGARYAR